MALSQTRKNLLSIGFVREYCKENNVEFLPSDIIELFILWLSLCDRFDKDLSHKSIQFTMKSDNNYIDYEQIAVTEFGHKTAIGHQIIRKGDRQLWTFQLIKNIKDAHVILGIIDNKTANQRKGIICDFSFKERGYGLYLNNMYKYCGTKARTRFEYGTQFEFKTGDMITMELDLTNQVKGGQLRFTFHSIKSAKYIESSSNVCYDNLDINEEWRGAVAIGNPKSDAVCLLPFNPHTNSMGKINII